MMLSRELFRPTKYVRPTAIKEVVQLLVDNGSKVRLIAGGTDLLVAKDSSIETIVDVAALGLNYIKADSDGIKIGAATTFKTIEISPVLNECAYKILATACGLVGTPQMRNMATLGGNICSSVPSADSAPALLALNAKVVVEGPNGQRTIDIKDFFLHVRKNSMAVDEMLVEIQLPTSAANTKAEFFKQGRVAVGDLPQINGAVSLTINADGICEDAVIAIGAAAPIPMRTVEAEAVLRGQKLSTELFAKAAEVASGEISPISDIRASAEYRKVLCRVLVERTLVTAAGEL